MRQNNISSFTKLLMSLGLVKVTPTDKNFEVISDDVSSKPRKHPTNYNRGLAFVGGFILLAVGLAVVFGNDILEPNIDHSIVVSDAPTHTTTLTAQQIIDKYPSPSALQKALDVGEIYYFELPPEIQQHVKP